MQRRYHILDVFTDTKLAGNPVAVVLDSDGLGTEAMQRIAREFNLSETVFCAPPRDPVNSAAVRIFTPTAELPFAGHPTIGTAVLLGVQQAPDLLAREDVGLVLEARIGTISCSVRRRRGEAPHAHFEAPRLAEPDGAAPDDAALAELLSLPATAIRFGAHRPTRFTAGNAFTFVPLESVEALGRARLRDTGESTMLYLYTPGDTVGTTRSFRTRALSVGYGIPEDPATGSAAAAFPGALVQNEHLPDGDHDCILQQGVEMGRPSRIGIAFSVEGGRLTGTTIGGSAVFVAEGAIDV